MGGTTKYTNEGGGIPATDGTRIFISAFDLCFIRGSFLLPSPFVYCVYFVVPWRYLVEKRARITGVIVERTT